MHSIDELVGPTSPHLSEERKVVVLKQKDGDSLLFMQHPHLAHNFSGFACAHNATRGGAIESVYRTERTSAGTTSTCQYRHDAATEDHLRFVIAVRIRKLIKF